jgi:hypothetical protein
VLRRALAGLAFALVVAGVVLADETRGVVTKVEDDSITIRTGGGFGKNKTKGEEKTYKVSKDVKVTKAAGKAKEAVKLTLDELKTAAKVTTVNVTVTHDGDAGTEIKVGGAFGGFRPKQKNKKDDK